MMGRLPPVLLAGALLLLPVPGAASAAARDGKEDPGAVAAALRMILEAFGTVDANGDGRLTEAELPARDAFAALDADRDGLVSREELGKALKAAELTAAGKKPAPAAGEEFAAWARRRVSIDPRFNAEARRTEFLANFDRDPKDGKIQRKEYAGADGDRVFRDFDAGKDGALDERELLALAKDQIADLEKSRRRPNRGNFLVLFDLDDDRRVTRDEYAFLRGPASVFVSYDEDADGVVTYDEILYASSTRDRRARGMGAAAPAPPPEKKDVWSLYDKDGDGRVTPAEFAGGEAVFRRLDRNRDGSLTAADL